MKITQIALFLLTFSFSLSAQEFGFGVKAGLSFSTTSGPTDAGESYGYKSGFHVGPSFTLKYTDYFGVRLELLYNQLGSKYDYEGASYFVLRNDNDMEVAKGDKKMNLNTFLNYVDIPLQVYYKVGETIEFFAGANVLFLAGGTGGGKITFEGTGTRPNPIETRLDYSYNSDKARESVGTDVNVHTFRRTDYEVSDALGAYYDFEEKDGRIWNTVDYGLHGGFRVLFNKALYLEGRAYYGFSDISNNDMDIKQNVAEGAPAISLSDDEDRNIAFGVSLGFSF